MAGSNPDWVSSEPLRSQVRGRYRCVLKGGKTVRRTVWCIERRTVWCIEKREDGMVYRKEDGMVYRKEGGRYGV